VSSGAFQDYELIIKIGHRESSDDSRFLALASGGLGSSRMACPPRLLCALDRQRSDLDAAPIMDNSSVTAGTISLLTDRRIGMHSTCTRLPVVAGPLWTQPFGWSLLMAAFG